MSSCGLVFEFFFLVGLLVLLCMMWLGSFWNVVGLCWMGGWFEV